MTLLLLLAAGWRVAAAVMPVSPYLPLPFATMCRWPAAVRRERHQATHAFIGQQQQKQQQKRAARTSGAALLERAACACCSCCLSR